jgi:hypothetical protein
MLPRIMPVPSGGATGDSQLSSDHVGAVAEAPRLGIQPEWLEVWWDKPSSSVTGFRPGFTGVSRTVLGGGTIRCLSHVVCQSDWSLLCAWLTDSRFTKAHRSAHTTCSAVSSRIYNHHGHTFVQQTPCAFDDFCQPFGRNRFRIDRRKLVRDQARAVVGVQPGSERRFRVRLMLGPERVVLEL